jgi:hydrocephalus-inducing protein
MYIPVNVCRPVLPDYLLDFGHVVLGKVCTRTVHVTNSGWFPVSFSIDRASRYQSGFTVDLPRVVQLPGAPDHEAVDFVVTFDPRGANLSTGSVEVFVPINVSTSIQFSACVFFERIARQRLRHLTLSNDFYALELNGGP